MIIDKQVSSMEELTRELNALPNNYIFRGQADAHWGLQSSLERLLGNSWTVDQARKVEDYALQSFKSKFRIYCGNEHQPQSKLSWLSAMQHYGAPTRLIDFTTSPYIALYFALETYIPKSGNSFSLFYIDYSSLMEQSVKYIGGKDKEFRETRASMHEKQDDIFEKIIDRYTYDVAWVSESAESNARIDRQFGTFLISGSLESKIDGLLSLDLYSKVDMVKLVVPPNLYEGAFVALRKMGINSKTMYGDLAGLAKSIRMELSAYM